MFLSFRDAVVVLGLLVVYVGVLCGFRMIWITFRKKKVLIFMTLTFLTSFLHMCIGIPPTGFIFYLYFVIHMWDRVTGVTRLKAERIYFTLLMYSSLLTLKTICSAVHWNPPASALPYIGTHYLERICVIQTIIILQIHLLEDMNFQAASDLLPYCPAMLDIFDGFEMTETQLDLETNPSCVQPVWPHIVCLWENQTTKHYYLTNCAI